MWLWILIIYLLGFCFFALVGVAQSGISASMSMKEVFTIAALWPIIVIGLIFKK